MHDCMHEESRVEKRLAELVAFDTRNPGGDERPLAEKLARDLSLLGASAVEVLEAAGHFSAFARFGEQPPSLLLNAHIDTVPANTGYTSDPLVLVRRDRRLYGLGSADTKGAIAAILEALTLHKEAGRPPPNLAVLFSGDEELSGSCIHQFLASERTRGLVRAIVFEPTGCRVGTRHRGVYAARIRACSPGGHSSLADKVANPIAILVRAAVALDELGTKSRQLGPVGLQGICMNLAALEGGLAFNIIPAAATLTFSVRPPPGTDVQALVEEARHCVRAATGSVPTEWEAFASNPAFATREPSRFQSVLGELAQDPVDLPFGTEAGNFVERGIDAVVFGPGQVEQAHKADEFISLDELMQAVRILGRVIS
jgi:acetylornithine deacetylase